MTASIKTQRGRKPKDAKDKAPWLAHKMSPRLPDAEMKWVGALSRYAGGKVRSMTEVRAGIAEAMANGELD